MGEGAESVRHPGDVALSWQMKCPWCSVPTPGGSQRAGVQDAFEAGGTPSNCSAESIAGATEDLEGSGWPEKHMEEKAMREEAGEEGTTQSARGEVTVRSLQEEPWET